MAIPQLRAIIRAQWLSFRNRLPRTTVGGLLAAALAVVWYAMFAALAIVVAFAMQAAPLAGIRTWFGFGLFGVFLFWQVVPLITLTAGWSLDLKRLRPYPIATQTLLGAEAMLRISAAFEMLMILIAAAIGLVFNPAVPVIAALSVLLFIPFNLLMSLGIRDLIAGSFQARSKLRYIFVVCFFLFAVAPNALMRTGLIKRLHPESIRYIDAPFTPWHEAAQLVAGPNRWLALAIMLAYLALAWMFARQQFAKTLIAEDGGAEPSPPASARETGRSIADVLAPALRLFKDPVRNLVEKELRTLIRMPRIRVIFFLATVFSIVAFLPAITASGSHPMGPFQPRYGLAITTIYGILILSDALLWNQFGFDRAAAQIYFCAPVRIEDVLRAKNIVAAFAVSLQCIFCMIVSSFVIGKPTFWMIILDILGAIMTILLFSSIGNMISVLNARAADPKATFKKQNTGMIQVWMLGCTALVAILQTAAYIAAWALDTEWAAAGVFLIIIAAGAVAYRISLQSASQKAMQRREEILSALDRFTSIAS